MLNRTMIPYLPKTRTSKIDLVMEIVELKTVRGLSKARPVPSDFSDFTGSQL